MDTGRTPLSLRFMGALLGVDVLPKKTIGFSCDDCRAKSVVWQGEAEALGLGMEAMVADVLGNGFQFNPIPEGFCHCDGCGKSAAWEVLI